MKKVILGLFFVCLSIITAVFFSCPVNASDKDITINTIYPEGVLDYVNLTNINCFDINNDYICYSLNDNNLHIYNLHDKNEIVLGGFHKISNIKLNGQKLIISDSNSIKFIKDLTNPSLESLEGINLQNSKAIDIYVSNTSLQIGIIEDNKFTLYQYDANFVSNNNPISTFSSPYFNSSYMLAVNDKNAYIVYKTGESTEEINKTITTGLATFNYHDSSLTILDTFIVNAKVLDTFYLNNEEYLVTSANEILHLQNLNTSKSCDIKMSTKGDAESKIFPILNITDINFFENMIYVSDSYFKSIQAVEIFNEETLSMQSNQIILGSFGIDKGRFKSPSNIFIQGNDYFVSDTGNNRLQIIKENQSYLVDDLETDSIPHAVSLDYNQNMYFVTNTLTASQLNKYTLQDNTYTKSTMFTKVGDNNLGFVSDLCVTNSGTIYMLDYSNNQIVYMAKTSLVGILGSDIGLSIGQHSQIEYLKHQNLIVIKNDNIISLLKLDGTKLSSIQIDNLREITVDLDAIYAITNTKISLIKVSENTLSLSNSLDITTDNFNNLTYDIANEKMVAFDNNRSCLVCFDCKLNTSLLSSITEISDTALTRQDTLLALKLNSQPIYEYPYFVGNTFNLGDTITQAIGIEEFDDFYRILFNNNNELQSGFVPKSNIEIVNYTYNPINVITTNQIVPIYKYPTLLRLNNTRLIVGNLSINNEITLSYVYPISLDNKTFYMYQFNNSIGFIFGADVVKSDNKTIKNLNTENASINSIGSDSTTLYDFDKQTILKTLENHTRIYVENYDKKQTYTKVIYKDVNLNTIEGYVLTKDIKMDKLDNSQLILILVIVISLVLLASIIVTFVIIKKRNK